jgi:hypothetical protein
LRRHPQPARSQLTAVQIQHRRVRLARVIYPSEGHSWEHVLLSDARRYRPDTQRIGYTVNNSRECRVMLRLAVLLAIVFSIEVLRTTRTLEPVLLEQKGPLRRVITRIGRCQHALAYPPGATA